MRTYLGLRGMEGKLDRLLTEFRFSSMASVYPDQCPSQAVTAVTR